MNQQTNSSGKIAKSAAVVSIAVMCSRVLGLIREQIFAGFFGAGYAYDAFVVAFRIPNLLRDLFGEGALSAAFVTVFSDYNANRSEQETWMLASNVLCFFGVALSLLVLLGIYFADDIVGLFSPHFRSIPGKAELTAIMTMIMMPFLVLISLSAVVMGILNTYGRFFIPSLASSFFNLGSIIGGTSLAVILPKYGYQSIIGMAIGTLVGGCLQLAIQLPTLKNLGFRFSPRLRLDDPGLQRIVKLMIPATIGVSATQINIFIGTKFASSCAEGSVSWLNYAFRLVQLPIGVFGVAISIAALPVFARFASQNNIIEMKKTFSSSLTMVFCLSIPATIGLIMLSEPIIRLIFQHGAFTPEATKATALALCLYAIGLFAYSAIKVVVPFFYALNQTKFPVIASFMAIIINIIVIVLTIDRFQYKAIALSTSVNMIVNFFFLTGVLYIKTSGFPLRPFFIGLSKIICAGALMAVLLHFEIILLHSLLAGNILAQSFALFLIIISAVFLYGLVLHFLQLPELKSLLDSFSRRFRRQHEKNKPH